MVITRTDMVLRLSGGLSNCDPKLSLGGLISTASCGVVKTDIVENVFDSVSNLDLTQTIVGTYDYRCLYLFNQNPSGQTLQNVSIWIELNTASPFTDIDIGMGLSGMGEIEQTIANEHTPPMFVAWSTAKNESLALSIGSLPAGKWKAIWIRRHSGPAPSGSSTPRDSYRLRYKANKIPGISPPPPPGTPPPSPPTPPSPPPPGTPPGPPPTPPPTGNKDVFGVTKIYEDNTSSTVSQPFFMSALDLNTDCNFDPQQTLQKNADNSWKNTSSTTSRFMMFTKTLSGCSRDVIKTALANLDSYNHGVWADRGYMWQPKDWKDVEITCYFKIVNAGSIATGAGGVSLECKGGLNSSTVSNGCAGPAYLGTLTDDGKVNFTKKQFHNPAETCGDSNTTTPSVNTGYGNLRNKWFGMKFMCWNYVDEATSTNAIHLEIWADKDATDVWQKVYEMNDTGDWYAGTPSTSCAGDEFCGGEKDQIMTWRSPVCGIQFSPYTEVHFKWGSVREILIEPTTTPPPPPTPTPGTKLTISSITAKGHDGNVPANVNDGNLATRWSHSPVPTWINLDLGSMKRITAVKIAWYNGNTRRMGFTLKAENPGGAQKTLVFTGTSSGTTTQLETYDLLNPIERQKIIIDVLTNSDEGNAWASITEAEVHGTELGASPPPPPPGSPPPPPSSSQKDVFGISEIYTTKPGSTKWAATAWNNAKTRTISEPPSNCTKDPYDSKFAVNGVGGPVVTINGTGVMKVNGPRAGGTSCRVVILGTWTNVESTIYIRCPTSTHASGIIDLRTKTDHYCVTSGNFGGYIHHLNFDDQEVYFKKEIAHDVGYSPRMEAVPLTLSANTWIGIKGIVYNLPDGDVKLETWIDTTDGANGGTWVKRTEGIDDGTWIAAPVTKSCGGSGIRSDTNVTNGYFEYKKWSVREIVPPT